MAELLIPKSQADNQALAEWGAQQIPWLKTGQVFGPCTAWGIVKKLDPTPRLMGVLVFNNYRPEIGDIELNVITHEPNWASPNIARTVADYVFNSLHCKRCSVTLPKGAKRNRIHAERLGFKLEGVKRKGFFNGADGVFYGMLKEECKFLRTAA